ncbi:adenylate/guanylate cyclase domain-containing protein (plasmid) [Sinorhizobium medicae WSM1115]|uniref:adenylate/guanylate cyclase domain-containing protein n=1 Tax=Sinorhizobium medicae TaxID=110321 RepID=UPI000362AD66|nr:adenylate/guanylate cyclase domain-containing protein [Sinorhizobium medicae]UFX04728.1 adenylate/guanylate cyclase domain-containing protein [Sinorhizobium medicae WSM1115]
MSGQAISKLIEWLAGDDCHRADDGGLAEGLGQRLRAHGLPLDRLTLHLRTLHPEIFGRSVAWAPSEPVEVREREHGFDRTAGFAGNPIRNAMETGEPVMVRIGASNRPLWVDSDLFRDRGLVEFYIMPLRNADGTAGAASFATTQPSGFTDLHRAAIDRIAPALRNACELRTLRRIEHTLLDTYIGASPARRVLAGGVRRGQVEKLEAALMLCDLRGFTELSNQLSAERVLELLNGYFDQVVPAITQAGGEVIKFMGDAALAFFDLQDPATSCNAALASAFDALKRLQCCSPRGVRLHAGIALHYGQAAYGNIGASQRLDFTLIGTDVNLVSRIQGVCSATGHRLILSARCARLLHPDCSKSIGRHRLRGFPEHATLYVPASHPASKN